MLKNATEKTAGLRVPGAWDGFELAVRAVLGQQISVSAARTLASRFAAAFGSAIDSPFATLTTIFPAPEKIADLDVNELIKLGILPKRAQTILAFATALANGELVSTPGVDALATIEKLQNYRRYRYVGRRTILQCARSRGLTLFRTLTTA